jgi:hypothetical protein
VWEHVHGIPPRIIEDLMVKIQAAVTMVDDNMLRHVRKNSVQISADFL